MKVTVDEKSNKNGLKGVKEVVLEDNKYDIEELPEKAKNSLKEIQQVNNELNYSEIQFTKLTGIKKFLIKKLKSVIKKEDKV